MKSSVAVALAKILTTPAKAVDDIQPGDVQFGFERWEEEIMAELEASMFVSLQASWPAGQQEELRILASQYARARSGELVRGITETTRARLSTLVANTLENGEGIGGLARSIRDDLAFSAQRAKLIAVTETGTALGQARRTSALAQGQNEKKWYTQADGVVCSRCSDNASAGWVGIEDPFPSGADTIPGHPGCRCDVGHRTKDEEARAVSSVMAEARCPTCNKLAAKDIALGATLFCRRCKREFTAR